MADDEKVLRRSAIMAVQTATGGPTGVDDQANAMIEDEIVAVINQVVKPYLLETIPLMIRKINHQGVLDKLVRTHCENILKRVLDEYLESATGDLRTKIDKKFQSTIVAEFDTRIEQAAKKLLDERLLKLRQEFGK